MYIYIYMYVCMYVYIYVCMYIYIYCGVSMGIEWGYNGDKWFLCSSGSSWVQLW